MGTIIATKQQLLEDFQSSLPAWRSISTLTRYPYIVGRFIEFAGARTDYSKADAMKFLNHLARGGAKNNYIRWTAFAVSAFYRSLGLPAPFTKGELPPRPQESELVKPALTTTQVIELIHVVKSSGTNRMKAYLALSTVYGPRAAELAAANLKNISGDSIIISTVKHGSIFSQPLPVEIRRYVHGYDFKPITTQTLGYLFQSMQKLAGHKHKPREGFHSIRRRLVRGLEDNGAKPRYINLFMRWSSASSFGIRGVYSHPDESEHEAAHKEIFTKHPFLKDWR